MTHLVNDARTFPEEALAGFVAAHPDEVVRVRGGVVRSAESPPGQVALVVGGGSGHYPAFAGWVGPGMAHGAVCGNVFASPSATQVRSVARAADNGGGVLLGFGNYAGDVLHFGEAAEQLRTAGLEVRTIAVTDDIASAPPRDHSLRRGVAGDLVVFKTAGAAAEAGYDLDGVTAVAQRANRRTRTLGLAFSGCTLPGAAAPLFSVPEGVVAVGLGIHGEPGLDEAPVRDASGLADVLVDAILAEEPPGRTADDTGRVAVVVNGLGSTAHEELFVVYGRIAERLAESGLTVVGPAVGEHVTSLDMAGLSVTVTYLDPELERLWLAPADTPAFVRGRRERPRARRAVVDVAEPAAVVPGTPESCRLAGRILAVLVVVAQAARRHAEELGDLDAVAGDGDHGTGMVLGSEAAVREVEHVVAAGGGARTALVNAGMAWSDAAGGTSGALWGAALSAAGSELSDDRGSGPDAVCPAVRRAVEAVMRVGGARPGDKTVVDALVPFAEALEEGWSASVGIDRAMVRAARVATESARATASLTARLGRARSHGSRSRGHPDPGATSFALLASAVADALAPVAESAEEGR